MIFRWETFKEQIPHFMYFDPKLRLYELENRISDTINQLIKVYSETNEKSLQHYDDQLMIFYTKVIKRGIFGIYFW